MMPLPDLPQLRIEYAQARAELRRASDVYELAKAASEAQICARANGELGKNAEDRKRNLQVALGQGPDYLQALDTVRRWEQRTEHLQALIDAQTDIRRRDEWAIRARLVDALLALGASGEAPDPHTEAPFDDTLDHSTLQRAAGAAMAYLPDEDLPF